MVLYGTYSFINELFYSIGENNITICYAILLFEKKFT